MDPLCYATVIHWYGPIPLARATKIADQQKWCEGLYMAIGRLKPWLFSLGNPPLQYVGLTRELNRRPDPKTHHKLVFLSPTAKIWLGLPVSQFDERRIDAEDGESDEDLGMRVDLKATEHLLALSLECHLNDKDRRKLPRRPCVIINRWFDYRNQRKLTRRPHRLWPDLLEYDGLTNGVRLTWVGRSTRTRRIKDLNELLLDKNSRDPIGKLRRHFWKPREYEHSENPTCPPLRASESATTT